MCLVSVEYAIMVFETVVAAAEGCVLGFLSVLLIGPREESYKHGRSGRDGVSSSHNILAVRNSHHHLRGSR